jgi:L-2-hydroxyglutarate oxidase LhgO
MLGINDDQYQIQFWKGSYFWINNNAFSKLKYLVYPVPNKQLAGLGIHLTKGLDGRIKLGPDHEYLGASAVFDYSINIEKKKDYFKRVKEYLPFLELDDLQPDFSGIRPKLQKPNDKVKDFIICNEKERGYNNFINLIGIESPGLTSSLAIGNYIKGII